MQPKYEIGVTFKVAKLSFVFAGADYFKILIFFSDIYNSGKVCESE